ncbi:hypothetical protein [Pseudoxanthomonas sp. z9]|uniref:hypothetical protein n=1 Tax=Pseudoxanthomonas sp. z9 TaxID=2584942 RepID=UPI0015E88A85|nr:hypothetical protein [Pseudoxanthomonas sp. z9]
MDTPAAAATSSIRLRISSAPVATPATTPRELTEHPTVAPGSATPIGGASNGGMV